MTREKYESLPLSTLKEVAKTRGLRGISTMKKADLIDLMLEEDDKDSIKEAKEEVKSEKAGTPATCPPVFLLSARGMK